MGLFSIPTTIPDSVSLEVPTRNAFKYMVRGVASQPGVEVVPIAVGLCFTPKFTPYSYNNRYGFANKHSKSLKGNATQMHQMVLVRPRYHLLGILVGDTSGGPHGEYNHVHRMQAQFMSRLFKGSTRRMPYFGQKHFQADSIDYPKTPIKEELNFTIPIMPEAYLDNQGGRLDPPQFSLNVRVKGGVYRYPDTEAVGTVVKNGILEFADPRLQGELDKWRINWRRANKGKVVQVPASGP